MRGGQGTLPREVAAEPSLGGLLDINQVYWFSTAAVTDDCKLSTLNNTMIHLSSGGQTPEISFAKLKTRC